MFFALDDEQRAFAATVRSFLADRFDLAAVRAVVEDVDGDGHPAALWQGLAEQGATAVLVPEEHDGLGLGLLDAQVIARELGAGVAPGPWPGTVLAGEALRLAGTDDQRATWLPKIAAGEAIGAVALRASGGRYRDGEAPFAVRDGALHGTAVPVDYAGLADLIIAATDDGLYLVTPDAPGVTITALAGLDGTVRSASVTLDGVGGEPLPGGGVTDLLERGAVLTAADLVGIAREALSRTVAYDREREQFGKPVGSFQALKHHLADLHVGVTMAEHAVLYAAHVVDTAAAGAADDPAVRLAVSVAKAKASDTAVAATGAMIQYHGGIGYTWEHEAHLFYKRAKRLAAVFGDAAAHRERIADLSTVGAAG